MEIKAKLESMNLLETSNQWLTGEVKWKLFTVGSWIVGGQPYFLPSSLSLKIPHQGLQTPVL